MAEKEHLLKKFNPKRNLLDAFHLKPDIDKTPIEKNHNDERYDAILDSEQESIEMSSTGLFGKTQDVDKFDSIFSMIDKDNDGCITVDELETFLIAFDIKLPGDNNKEAIYSELFNNGNTLSKEKFYEFLQTNSPHTCSYYPTPNRPSVMKIDSKGVFDDGIDYDLHGIALEKFFKEHKLANENFMDETDYDYCIVTKRKIQENNSDWIHSCMNYLAKPASMGDFSPKPEIAFESSSEKEPTFKCEFDRYGKYTIDTIIDHGMHHVSYYGVNDQEIFSLIKIPNDVLQKFASKIEYEMLLDQYELEKAAKQGDVTHGIQPIDINDDPYYSKLSPYEHIYGKYSTKYIPESLYWRPNSSTDKYFRLRDTHSPFREMVRLELISLLMESKPENGYPPLRLRKYLNSGRILGCFTLHDRYKSQLIWDAWFIWWKVFYPNFLFEFFTNGQHVKYIREYFGSRIYLYFRFVQHYSKWLIFPAVIGIPVQISIGIPKVICPTCEIGQYTSISLPIYSFLISIWSVLMLEFWSRAQKVDTQRIGTLGCKDHELDRPDYKGRKIKSFIDGSEILHACPYRKACRVFASFTSILLMIIGSLSVIASIYVIRKVLYESIGFYAAQVVASSLNAIQIAVFNVLYGMAASYLNNWENHRTESEYEDALIAKLFFFQFVNSYSSCFYIAFIAQYMPAPPGSPVGAVGECGGPDCMEALSINLSIIFALQFLNGSLFKAGPAYIISFFKSKEFQKDYTRRGFFSIFNLMPQSEFRKISRPETEYLLVQVKFHIILFNNI